MPISEFRFNLEFLLSFCPNDEKWYFWFFLDSYRNRNIFNKELTPKKYYFSMNEILGKSRLFHCHVKIKFEDFCTRLMKLSLYIYTQQHTDITASPYPIDPGSIPSRTCG